VSLLTGIFTGREDPGSHTRIWEVQKVVYALSLDVRRHETLLKKNRDCFYSSFELMVFLPPDPQIDG